MKTRYLHYRQTDLEGHLIPKGGATVSYTPTEEGAQVGVSICSPRENFSRRIGRHIATGRAQLLRVDTQHQAEQVIEVADNAVREALDAIHNKRTKQMSLHLHRRNK